MRLDVGAGIIMDSTPAIDLEFSLISHHDPRMQTKLHQVL